jgi:amino-acid N-acetyltransferase
MTHTLVSKSSAVAVGARPAKAAAGRMVIRSATPSEAPRIHALITANLTEGHLLPRTLDELNTRAPRFAVAVRARKIVGCAELVALSTHVAEVRSLAVDAAARHHGVGAAIVDELRRRARREGFERLCAFTHAPGYFIQMGFSIVPHSWVLEKLMTDCVKCPLFRTCGQHAMIVPLESPSVVESDRPAVAASAASVA